MPRFLQTAVLIFLIGMHSASTAHSATYVFLDFSGGFDAALDGIYGGTFSASDKTDIKDAIESKLVSTFAGFDITFSQVTSGGSEDVIDFDETLEPGGGAASPTLLGWAPFEWYNLGGYSETNVLTMNFDGILDETPSLPDAKAQIAAALAGTAAHEFGHSVGLRHHDAYGDPTITPSATGGLQNAHIMATGPTGLTEEGRETDRTLSRNSLAKMEITAAGPVPLVSSSFFFIPEAAPPHDMAATAHDITPGFQWLPISETSALKLHAGSLGPGGTLSDWYKFSVPSAGLLNAEILSLGWYVNGVETNLALYDSTLTPLVMGNDVHYDAGFIDYSTMSGGGPTFHQSDPLIMNFAIAPGEYFLEIIPEIGGTDTDVPGGVYDLYLNIDVDFDMMAPTNFVIPEPSTGLLLLFAAGIYLPAARHRRKGPLF